MLVVITIMAILLGLAATMMRPDLEGRRTREAARAVNVYFSSARNRAMETGRPCGVILHRVSPAVPAAMSMDQCEVPPTFAGQNFTSVVRVQDWSASATSLPAGSTVLKAQVQGTSGAIDFSKNLLHRGDLVQLNGQGPWYTIVLDTTNTNPADFPLVGQGSYLNTDDLTSIDFTQGKDTSIPPDNWIDTNWLTLQLAPAYAQQTPWPKGAGNGWSQPVPFSVLRQPAKGTESPLQLPAGAAIDLDFSGIDYAGDLTAFSPPPGAPAPKFPDSYNWFDATWFDTNLPIPGDVTILFGPTGAVQSVSIVNVGAFTPTKPIFLLVGKRERIPSGNLFPTITQGNPATWPNWYDLKNIWVMLNPQSGLISTGENGSVNSGNGGQLPTWTDRTTWRQFIVTYIITGPPQSIPVPVQCRALARDAQSMGGK
jgi:type II secretory pathway pseudopilin PulG